jgi:methylase of polypeptide subunit release factors
VFIRPEPVLRDRVERAVQSDNALVELGRLLELEGYRFVPVTPATHASVNARPENALANGLDGVFGWSRRFHPDLLPQRMLDLLDEADAIEVEGNVLRSRVRFATLDGMLFVHSAFPTTAPDSVFFGPDTYRFAAMLRRLPFALGARVLDIGAGSGAGGLTLSRRAGGRIMLLLSDVNQRALRYAEINAAINRCREIQIVLSDVLDGVDGQFDLIVANPPYMIDPGGPAYRDGGADGIGLALRIVCDSLPRLTRNGTLALYTGTAIRAGRDAFRDEVAPMIATAGFEAQYDEIDPDLFGEELDKLHYADVERIAAVSLIVRSRVHA